MAYSDELPLHKQIYESLRKNITDGVYKEGDILPSENQLCQLHHATRPTVRKALERLSTEGYISRRQGKGSIAKGIPSGIGILSLSGTTSAIGQENLTTKIITKPELREWNTAFTFQLSEKEKGNGCLYLERLRLINNTPVFFDITKIPNINLPRFTQKNFENKSLFDILRKNYQIEVKGGEQKLLAITADKKLQRYFNVKTGHPILQVNRKISTNRPDFYFYSQIFCNTESYTLYGTF
ncbi:MAG: GntR family transcriptional regulator [Prolixibacteraceae bacterium]|nr:GntR family transcriptional regulator [Prolixibacteraceae bacterium]